MLLIGTLLSMVTPSAPRVLCSASSPASVGSTTRPSWARAPRRSPPGSGSTSSAGALVRHLRRRPADRTGVARLPGTEPRYRLQGRDADLVQDPAGTRSRGRAVRGCFPRSERRRHSGPRATGGGRIQGIPPAHRDPACRTAERLPELDSVRARRNVGRCQERLASFSKRSSEARSSPSSSRCS